jgi:bis(5'-adenosyl)-triphosphatase
MKRGRKESKCAFCRSNQHLAVIFNTKRFRAIYNQSPIVPGHCLLIPRRHVEYLLDLTKEEWLDLRIATKRLLTAVLGTFETRAFDLALQEGREAGQSVHHLHFHILPRTPRDLSAPGKWYRILDRQNTRYESFRARGKPRPNLTLAAMKREARKIAHYDRINACRER